MDRRQFLKSGPIVGAVGLTGCLELLDETGPEATPDPTPFQAEFEIVDTSIEDEEVVEGELIRIAMTIRNTGEVSGQTDIELAVDDEIVRERQIELEGGEEVVLGLWVYFDSVGEFEVYLNGMHIGQVSVVEVTTWFVDPDGSDTNRGTEDSPLRTIQAGIDKADPGDTVSVNPGEYVEPIKSVRSGEPGDPITITGPPEAVLKSSPSWWYPVEVRHSHIHLTGLTIDGLENPDAPDDPDSYSDAQLIQARPPATTDEYLTDLLISPHGIGNTQKEMISLERTRDSEVGPFRVIGPAGASWVLTGEPDRHNGEIVYLGTAEGNLGSDWHPWTEYDQTRNIRVHHIDNSEGYGHSQLVDAKTGVHNVTVEYCTDGGGSQNTEDWVASSVALRGHNCTLRFCRIQNPEGDAVLFDNWHAVNAEPDYPDDPEIREQAGKEHEVYRNEFMDVGNNVLGFGGSVGPDDQEIICGNDYDDDTEGEPGASCPDEVPEGEGIGHSGGDSPWG